MQVRNLPVSEIHLRGDARAVDAGKVEALANSISMLGLMSPIQVRAHGDGWEVVFGAHRLGACQRLGLVEIEAFVSEADDIHAEIAMHHENMVRNELSPAEMATTTARLKILYENINGPAKANSARAANASMGRGGDVNEKSSFTSETAKATGQSERIVQLNAERGSKVIADVIDMITGTKLDTATYLDKLKKLTPNDQVTAAKRDLALIKSQQRDATKAAVRSRIDSDVRDRAAQSLAERIVSNFPADEIDAAKADAFACGAKALGIALTNLSGQSIMDRRYK